MVERVLPPRIVVAVSTRGELWAPLAAAEAAAIRRALAPRRREFTTARACARAALVQLGLTPLPLPVGPDGEPRWPRGVVGSITHCEGYRAAAVARTVDLAALAIDAEPNRPLPPGVLTAIALPAERSRLRRCPAGAAVCWDRLLFSAKEAVFKLWFPLTGEKLGFEDASVGFDPAAGTFTARLSGGRPLLRGRWRAAGGLLASGICLAPAAATSMLGDRQSNGEWNGSRAEDDRSGAHRGGTAGVAEDV